ncbi:MAG: excinuclease ABC subunit B, partial [Verrucomicrobiota bacterium]
MKQLDISHVLDGWPYEPGKAMVRKVKGDDGRELIQMRIDLGILQMYTSGRPDGLRPKDSDSLLDYHVQSLEDYLAEHDGDDEGFSLTSEECLALQH